MTISSSSTGQAASSSSSSSSYDTSVSRYNVLSGNTFFLTSFQKVKYASTLSHLLEIIRNAVCQGSLEEFLSEVNDNGKSLRGKIVKKSQQMPAAAGLLKFINQTSTSSSSVSVSSSSSSSYARASSSTSSLTYPNSSVDTNDVRRKLLRSRNDLSNEILERLRKTRRNYVLPPLESSQDDKIFENLLKLSDPKNPFLPIYSTEIIDNRDHYLCELLHHAVKNNFLNFVDYLTNIGADINSLELEHFSGRSQSKRGDPYLSPILKSVHGILSNISDENAHSIFSSLLAERKPVSLLDLAKIIHFCSQHYLEPNTSRNLISNYHLFNHTLSILLGQRIHCLISEKNRTLLVRYLNHIHSIGGQAIDAEITKGVNLEGMREQEFVHARLRLFLQIIIENRFPPDKVAEVYDEFLLELETAWVTQLFEAWGKDQSNRRLIKDFSSDVAGYIAKQVGQLAVGKEYPVQLGWPKHSVVITFMRFEENKLAIRVDNSGEESDNFHPTECSKLTTYVQSRIYVKSRIAGEMEFISCQEPIKNYLQPIIQQFIDLKFRARWDEANRQTKGNTYKKIYKPSRIEGMRHIKKGDRSSLSLTMYRGQIVGNCTFTSHAIGVKERLGKTLSGEISSAESAILNSMNDLYLQAPSNLPVSAQDKLWSLEKETFPTFLHHILSHHYKENAPGFHFPNPPVNPATQRSIDDFLAARSSTRYGGVFYISERSFLAKINGSAGVGKTSFALSYATKIQSDIEKRTFDFTFLIKLRNLSKKELFPPLPSGEQYSLLDLIDREIVKPTLNRHFHYFERCLLQNLFETKKILWILDGLDELPQQIPLFDRVLSELFSGRHQVILTSRPGIRHPLISHSGITEYEIHKFSTKQITHFIETYFKNPGNEGAIRSLKQALESNKSLEELCEIPILLNRVCQAVKEGDIQVLESTSKADLTLHLTHASCQNAFKRKYREIIREGSNAQPTFLVGEKQSTHYFREALRFLEFLSFTSLKNHRNVVFSKKILDQSFNDFGIEEGHDKDRLEQELRDIGLIQIDANGGGFPHATFQDNQAASYLIKGLSKPATHERYESAQSFINKHKNDYNYQNVFASAVHQLCDRIRKTASERKRARLTSLLRSFLDNFTSFANTPLDMQREDRLFFDSYTQQAFPLLETYSQYIQDDQSHYNSFWESYKELVQNVLSLLISTKLIHPPHMIWEGTDKSILEAVLSFLTKNPSLRDEKLQFNERLTQRLRPSQPTCSSSTATTSGPHRDLSDEESNYLKNMLECMHIAQSLDGWAIDELKKIFDTYTISNEITQRMATLILSHLEKLVTKPAFSEQDQGELCEIQNILRALFTNLCSVPSAGKKKKDLSLNLSVASHGIASILPTLHRNREKIPEVYELCRFNLIEFTELMLTNLSPHWPDFWNNFPPLSRDIIPWETKLDRDLILGLRDFLYEAYNGIYNGTTSDKTLFPKWEKSASYDERFIYLGKLLQSSWNLIDLIEEDSEFGSRNKFFEKLFRIADNGHLGKATSGKSRPSRKNHKQSALEALSCYRPDFIARNCLDQLKLLDRICGKDLSIYPILDYLKSKRDKGFHIPISSCPQEDFFRNDFSRPKDENLLTLVIENMTAGTISFKYDQVRSSHRDVTPAGVLLSPTDPTRSSPSCSSAREETKRQRRQ